MAGQEVFERPRTRRAQRNSTTGFVVNEPEQTERPVTSRGRRSSVPSNYGSSPSPRQSGSDPITPRPPTSQRPSSRFRQNQRTLSQDHGVYQREEFHSGASTGSRPSTGSSLCRYTPLPSIGTKLDLYESKRNDKNHDLGDASGGANVSDSKTNSLSGPKVTGQASQSIKSRSGQKVTGQGHGSESKSQEKQKRPPKDNSKTSKGKTDEVRHNKGDFKENTDGKYDQARNVTSEKTEDNQDAINTFEPLKRNVKLPPEPSEKDKRLTLAVKLPGGQRIQRTFSPSNTLRNVIEFAEHAAKLDFRGCHLACNVPVKIFSKLDKALKDCGVEDRTIFHIHVP